MAKLKPKEKAYYAHFAAAAQAALTAAEAVATLSGPSADRRAVSDQLASLAEVADTEYHSVLSALHASFVTPFDRTEIQTLARDLAVTVRHLESAAALVNLLDPPQWPDELSAVTALLADAGQSTAETVGKLRKLKGIKHHHTQMRQIAVEAEFQRRLLLVRLTSGETDPLDAMEIRAIADELHAAVGGFTDVAEIVETVLITEG